MANLLPPSGILSMSASRLASWIVGSLIPSFNESTTRLADAEARLEALENKKPAPRKRTAAKKSPTKTTSG